MNERSAYGRAFRSCFDQLFEILTPEQIQQIADLRAQPPIADRIAVLADKANEGELSEVEREEYEGFIHANDIIAILQAAARSRLSRPTC
jgi:exonuclease I